MKTMPRLKTRNGLPYVDPKTIDRVDYERRVTALEVDGLTRSDAQGVVDLELLRECKKGRPDA
jgi:hypothetical protein